MSDLEQRLRDLQQTEMALLRKLEAIEAAIPDDWWSDETLPRRVLRLVHALQQTGFEPE